MALPSGAVWNARSGGSSGNGGFYNASGAGAGTDYSQQPAAQISVTDGIANGTTTITSATASFSSVHPRNGIKIGANWYEVVSVTNATTIVVDRTIGAASGLTMKLGGSLALPTDVVGVRVPGNVLYWMANATYDTAATLAFSDAASDGAPFAVIGYTTTPGDNGLVTVRWTGGGGGTIIDSTGALNIFRNVLVDGNGKTADRGLRLNAANCVGINCKAIDCNLSGLEAINSGTELRRSEATNCGSASAGTTGFGLTAGGAAIDCVSYSNVGNGFGVSNSVGSCRNCAAYGNTKSGFYCFGAGTLIMIECVADQNTLSGLRLDGTPEDSLLTIENCLFSNNARYGIESLGTDYSVAANAQMGLARRWNNAFYNNTLGARFQFGTGNNDLVPTTDPYVSQSTRNYALNGTSTGGGVLRGAGIPGGIGLITTPQLTVGYRDVGVAPGQSVAGSGSAFDTMVTLWREFTGEHDTSVPDNTVVSSWIDRGLEALNRRLRYHWTTDSTSIILVAGIQEYSLPADLIELRWMQWNGRELAKGDVQEWRRAAEEWRNETAGEPTQYAIYGDKLVIRPIPSGEAVGVAASPVFRYCSKPGAVATNGAEQLNSQNWPVAVMYGAAAYAGSYPDSAAFAARRDSLLKMFEDEVQTLALDYRDRALQR